MAKLFFKTLTRLLNTQCLFTLPLYLYITNIILHFFLLPFTATIPITITNTEDYLPSDDPNIKTLWFLTMIVKNNIIGDNLTS